MSAIVTRLKRSGEQSGEVLVITSAVSGEGKSAFARDLAFASAAAGARTLLIDGDDFAGDVSRSLGLKAPPLPGVAESGSELTKISAAGELYAVTLAHAPGTGTARFEALLQSKRQDFDTIIVDTPPIVPTGGGRLIDCADRVAIVAKWNATDRSAIADAMAMLEPYDRKVAGIVLTEASPRWYRFYVQGKYKGFGRKTARG